MENQAPERMTKSSPHTIQSRSTLPLVTGLAVATILMGVIYNAVVAKPVGLLVTGLLLAAVLLALVLAGLRPRHRLLPLALATGGGMAIFTGDIWVSYLMGLAISPFRIPFDASGVLVLSAVASLYLHRRAALVAGLANALNILVFTLFRGDPDLIRFNLIMQPVLVCFSILMFIYGRQTAGPIPAIKTPPVDPAAPALGSPFADLPVLDLGEFGVTEQEQDTIRLLVQGLNLKEIAALRGIGASAVQNRLGSLYRKLAVPDRGALMYLLGSHRLLYGEQMAQEDREPALRR